MIFWCQKIDFLISENNRHFFISKIQISDIKKSGIFWYQKFEFLISESDYLISENTSKILKQRLIENNLLLYF